MANVSYKDHIIVVYAALRLANKQWTPAVAIRPCKDGRYRAGSHAITDFRIQFPTQYDAMRFGIKAAKAWIDDQL